MDLFLHIGPHKTGTTAIQTAFADNAAALRRRGLLYPKCNWAYPAHHRLAFAMKDKVNPIDGSRPDFATELDALCQALEKSRLPRAFISSEEFFACPADRIARLKAALPVENVTILAYPRRPDTFLISCHNQKTKQVGNGFAAPITRFLKEPHKIAPEIDALACITAWADVFGNDNVALRPFEAGSPLDDMVARFGIEGIAPNKTLNSSVPGVVAEVMRLAKVQDMGVAQQRKLFAKANEVFADRPPFSINDADRLRIIETFEADNDALFARFGQENPYRTANFRPSQNAHTQNITVHDLMALITTLL
ncbi:MAG: hypothetical protein HKN27_00875 [Silicimonas sp.]|nr:hypothetical protein [Silicimonas sp.]